MIDYFADLGGMNLESNSQLAMQPTARCIQSSYFCNLFTGQNPMSSFLTLAPALIIHIVCVIGKSTRKKMRRSNALGIITVMQDVRTHWDTAILQGVCHAMRSVSIIFSIKPECDLAVTPLVNPSNPVPTIRSTADMGPKSSSIIRSKYHRFYLGNHNTRVSWQLAEVN